MTRYRFLMQFFIIALLLAATTALAAGQQLSVQVQEAQMRRSASFSGSLAATLVYGESVTVLEERGDWYRVRWAGETGWMHSSAFAGARTTAYSSGSDNVSAKVSEREVSMAGKGFNAQVEDAYRTTNPAGYAAVEAMLRINYSPGELEAFLAAGRDSRQGGIQ